MTEFEITINCNHKIIYHKKLEVITQKDGVIEVVKALLNILEK